MSASSSSAPPTPHDGSNTLFPGFDQIDVHTSKARIRGVLGGSGPPVLLLHGFPQTHATWHKVAPILAKNFTVVASDLRGYGDSVTSSNDFTFRSMAKDQVEVMHALGFDRFCVIGHDRGGRVAHRMAVDHKASVIAVALLDILPTSVVWKDMDADLALAYWHWIFLAQHNGLPEQLLRSAPEAFVRACLSVGGSHDVFSPTAIAAYEQAARRPSVQRAFCADYRAAVSDDVQYDLTDENIPSPTPALVLWGERGIVGRKNEPVREWARIFCDARGHPIPGGHFIPEESPELAARLLTDFLTTSGGRAPT